MNDKRVAIYTDGACSGNPGPGGWGAILHYDGTARELSGGEAMTTNNRMELLAAIESLGSLKRPMPVDLHSDSQYLRDGITKWIHGWKRNGWRTADRKPVKNAELWQALDAARNVHDVTFHWVKGHAGHALNERADELARLGMAPYKRGGGLSPTVHATPAAPGGPAARPPATLAESLRAAPSRPRRTTSRPGPATPRRSET